MARRIRISTWYARVSAQVVRPNAARADAVARTMRALASADDLPGPSDYEARGNPVGRAWVRRIGGRNLWLWYRFSDDEVILVTVTTEPPVPADA